MIQSVTLERASSWETTVEAKIPALVHAPNRPKFDIWLHLRVELSWSRIRIWEQIQFLSLVFFRSYYNQERYLWSSTHQVATSAFLNPFFPFSCCGCMISTGLGELAQWGFLSSSAHGAHGHESFMSVQNWISKQDLLTDAHIVPWLGHV